MSRCLSLVKPFVQQIKFFNTAAPLCKQHYRLVIAGGGTGGTTMSSKFGRKLGKGQVALIEPKQIKGLPDALETPGVCSNFHPKYVQNTFPAIQAFKGGEAVFTFPSTPIKCAGAPQKIMYLAEERFRMNGVRDKTNITYNSALATIFSSPKYAESLLKVMEKRKITFNRKHSLSEVNPDRKEVTFDILGDDLVTVVSKKTTKYDFLHIGPPCSPVKEVRGNKKLTNDAGWVTVNKETLQHTRYANIFALGDCTDIPTSKTAAAVSSQSGIVRKNLEEVMQNNTPQFTYDGYTSCPLLTSKNTCIMAEFDYTLEPKETFPFIDQRQESQLMFLVKKEIMPRLYWTLFMT